MGVRSGQTLEGQGVLKRKGNQEVDGRSMNKRELGVSVRSRKRK